MYESSEQAERFVQALTVSQNQIYAYIVTLLGDLDEAHDVLQEVNLVLWRKSVEFEEGMNFTAWACRIAKFQTLAFLRDRGRSRVRYSPEFIEKLAEVADRRAEVGYDERRRALHACMKSLTSQQQQLIADRYAPGMSVAELAAHRKRPVGSISQALYRIRKALAECIERRLEAGHGA